MFDYVSNDYNRHPQLVLQRSTPPPGRLVAYLPFSVAHYVDLPPTAADLTSRQRAKWWADLRRRERRLTETCGAVTFAVLSRPADIAPRLDEVRRLFAAKWHDEYTGLPWKTVDGFRPYAEAMLDLAARGEALLAVLDVAGRMVSFGYCLREPPWLHFYQHAATPEGRYRPYAPGKLLVSKLISHAVEDPEIGQFDFMLGDADYKREWATGTRQVLLRLEDDATARGRIRLAGRVAVARAQLYVRFRNPSLRRMVKWVLLRRQLREVSRPAPLPRSSSTTSLPPSLPAPHR